MSADTFRKLAALGLTTDQIAGVLDIMDEAAAQTIAREEARKADARERTRRWIANLDVSKAEWIGLSGYVKARDNFTCAYCGETDGPMHCDHVIPLSRGGKSTLDNLVTACRACNCGKRDKTVQEWRG